MESAAHLIMRESAPSGHESRYFLRSWSRYSNTRVSFFSVWITSCSRTMFGCCSSFRMEISRIAVEGIPSSSASSRIFLRAANSPDCRSRALYTTPYVPSPIFSIFWYFSCARRPGGANGVSSLTARGGANGVSSSDRCARAARKRGGRPCGDARGCRIAASTRPLCVRNLCGAPWRARARPEAPMTAVRSRLAERPD